MPGKPPVATKNFCYEFVGLKFDITLSTAADGSVVAKITVLEGRADFNALYWGDSLFSGASAGFTGRDSNLNLNGDASRINGDEIQWDGALKLSSPGLGKHGAGKATFLQAGESLTVTLGGVTSLDQVAYIGIRATSTSTPEGSIRAVDDGVCLPKAKDDDPKHEDPKAEDPKVDQPADPKHAGEPATDDAMGSGDGQVTAQLGGDPPKDPPPATPDFFPGWPQDISNIVLHYDLDGDGAADYSVKIDEFPEQEDGYDLDNVLGGLRSFVASENDVIDEASVLLGVSIKGGRQETQYFAVEGNKNGAEPDPEAAPENLRNTGPGNDDVLFYEDFVKAFGSIDDAPRDPAEYAEPEEPEIEPA